ncbi:hypothetical protein DPMN_193253 [Dreissena polymorpha]|uniref:Uncharacterized protein n=1 Tax=Dreissena polymorpha TaxID=45954 RepID=A0A9D3Y2Y0_DREPO|nr:hypothetical protein DPMN_193253 [Dreissena polymorpha]
MISCRCTLSFTVFILDFTGHLVNEHGALSGMNSTTATNVTLQRNGIPGPISPKYQSGLQQQPPPSPSLVSTWEGARVLNSVVPGLLPAAQGPVKKKKKNCLCKKQFFFFFFFTGPCAQQQWNNLASQGSNNITTQAHSIQATKPSAQQHQLQQQQSAVCGSQGSGADPLLILPCDSLVNSSTPRLTVWNQWSQNLLPHPCSHPSIGLGVKLRFKVIAIRGCLTGPLCETQPLSS